MSTLRDEAEALARALLCGVCDVFTAVSWADFHIVRDRAPIDALCEVSLAVNRYPDEVARMLRECPETPCEAEVNRLLVTLFDARLKDGRNLAERVAEGLSTMGWGDGAIEDTRLRGMALWAREALNLADDGFIRESRDEIVDQLAEALDHAASEIVSRWSFPDMTHQRGLLGAGDSLLRINENFLDSIDHKNSHGV